MSSSVSDHSLSQAVLVFIDGAWEMASLKLENRSLFLQREEINLYQWPLPVQTEIVSSPLNGQHFVLSLPDPHTQSVQLFLSFSSEELLSSFVEKVSQAKTVSTEMNILLKSDETDSSINSSTSASMREKLRRASFVIPKMKDLLNSNGLTEAPKILKNDSSSVSLSLLSPPTITTIKKTIPIIPSLPTEPFKHSLKPFPTSPPKPEEIQEGEVRKGYMKRLDPQATEMLEASWITQWVELELFSGRLKLFSEILSRKILRDTIDIMTSQLEIISFDNSSELFTFKISLSNPPLTQAVNSNPASTPKIWILSVENELLFKNWIYYFSEVHMFFEKREKELQAKLNAIPTSTQGSEDDTVKGKNKSAMDNPILQEISSSVISSSNSSSINTPVQSIASTPISTPLPTPTSTPTVAPKKLKINSNFLANMLNAQLGNGSSLLPEEKAIEKEEEKVEKKDEEHNSPQVELLKQLSQRQNKDNEPLIPLNTVSLATSCSSQLSPIPENENENEKSPINSPYPFSPLGEKDQTKDNDVTLYINRDKIAEASKLISELTFSIEKMNFSLGERLIRRLLLWYCSNGFSLTNGDEVDKFVEDVQIDPQADPLLLKFFGQKFDLFESWGSFLSILHHFEDSEAKKIARNPFQMQLSQLKDNQSEDLSLTIIVTHIKNENKKFSFNINHLFNVSDLVNIFSTNLNIDTESVTHLIPQILFNCTQSFLNNDNDESVINQDNILSPVNPSLTLILPSSSPKETFQVNDPATKGIFSLIMNRFSEDYILLQDLMLYQEEIVKEWWTKIANNKQVMKQKDMVINDLYEQITTLKEKKQEEGDSNIKNYVNDIFEKKKLEEEDDENISIASGIKKSNKSIINELKINKQNYLLEKQKLLDEIMILKLSLTPNTDKFYQQLQQNEELRKNLEDKLVEAHIEIDKQKDFIYCLQNDIENKNIIINECESQISSLKYKTKEMEAEIEALKVKVSVAEMIAKSNSAAIKQQVSQVPLSTPLSPGYAESIDLLTLANLDSPKNSRDNNQFDALGSDTDHPYLSKFEIQEDLNIHIPSKHQHHASSSYREESYNRNSTYFHSNSPGQEFTRDLLSPFEKSGKSNVLPPSFPSSGTLRSYMANNSQTPVNNKNSVYIQESPYQTHHSRNAQNMYQDYRNQQDNSVNNIPYNFNISSLRSTSYNQTQQENDMIYTQSNSYQLSQRGNDISQHTAYIQSLYNQQQQHPLRTALREEMKVSSRGTPERRSVSRRGNNTPTSPEPPNTLLLSSSNSRFMTPTNSWNLKSNR